MKRVLLISYTFPPTGGAGVQRAAKFAKFLPRFGWDVSVLTALNPSVPLVDESLTADVPACTIIEKARTLEPSYETKVKIAAGDQIAKRTIWTSGLKKALRSGAVNLLQPDAQILWAPHAIRRGSRLLKSHKHQAIFATAPPFSSFLVGSYLSRKFDLPLVLDYRDEWDISNAHWENRNGSALSIRWQRRQQLKLLRRSSAVIATTKSSASSIRELASQAKSKAFVTCIYNGYDPDDFLPEPCCPAANSAGVIKILYTGTLWNLTDISPLAAAIETLQERTPRLVERIELCVYGRRTTDQNNILARLATTCKVSLNDYAPHKDIVPLMSRASCLCVLLANSPDASRVVPAKLFEYMATGRPILVIAPKGEVWDLLAEYSSALLRTPDDVKGIAAAIAELANRKAETDAPVVAGVEEYSRPRQAQQLAEVLDSLT